MKITLINPPQLNVWDDRQYPPLGLLYLSTALRRKNIDVNVVDLASKREDEWADLLNDDATIYGMISFTPAIGHVQKIVALCRARNPECVTVVGGPHASAVPDDTLRYTGCDAVLVSEGEISFVNFVEGYAKTGKYEKIIRSELIPDLDELGFPARDLVDHNTYTAELYGKKTAPIISARGCPYQCSFCDKSVFGARMRFRSAQNVLGELRDVKERYGYESFFFYDDILTINHDRLYKLLAGTKDMEIQFLCDGRVNLMTPKLLTDLRSGGCVKIAYGIETGSQKILDLMNKQTTIQQCIDGITAARDAGIFTKCYFVFGLPGEDEKTVEETKELIEKANPDQANLYTFIPFPGSDIWNRPAYYGIEIINRDFNNYYFMSNDGTGGINYRLNGISEDKYIELRDDLMKFIRARRINRPEVTSNI